MLIPGYPTGADITCLNTIYQYPKRDPETGKYGSDKIIILYKDNTINKKFIHEIENPTYTFYKANDDVYLDHHLFFIEDYNVEPVTVPYKDVLKTIAEMSGNEEFFYNNIKNRDRNANQKLHTLPNIFGSDIHIEDAYRLYFDLEYKNDPIAITKSYFDIEVDTAYMKGDFPELGECPINALSFIHPSTNKVYVLLLRDENNPLIEEFEKELKSGKILKELKEFVINHVGGPAKAQKHNIFDFDYEIIFYDDERNHIIDFFNLVNHLSPDFLLAWNMSFDIPYIIERGNALGLNMAEIMSDKEAVTKIAKYYIDVRNKQLPAQRGDYFTINSKVIYLDQLVHFASRRKGQAAFDNLKLDNIGNIIAGVGKLDWSHIAKTFAEFPRKNYKLFVFYNIMDTIVQHCIENKVGDIDYVFNKALINNTRYHKAHRQTVYLANRGIKEFRKQGYIMCNNNNRDNEKPPKFPGAHVGDPMNNSDYSKMKINGEPINIVNNLDDFDYKALYPSTMREFNISPNTQIGKINIDHEVHDKENPFNYDKYCRGGQFVEDFRSGNFVEFCHRWMHLANYKEFLDDMEEYFSTHIQLGLDPTKPQPLVQFYGEDESLKDYDFKMNLVEPTNHVVQPLVQMYPGYRNFDTEIEHIRNTAQMDLDNIELMLRRREREREEDEELEKLFSEEDKVSALSEGGDE